MGDLPPWIRRRGAAIADGDIAAMQAFMAQTVREAGALTLRHFRAAAAIDNKAREGAYDPVTVADREAESLIRARIAHAYPNHGILGEEHGYEAGSEPLTWVIDPIDGTRSFITGSLGWGVLLALFDGVRPRIGAMYQPYTRELFIGADPGAWFEFEDRKERMTARTCTAIEDAVVCATTPEMFATERTRHAFERIAGKARLVRFGGDCYSYCMLAMGHIDLIVESSLEAYDIQALVPIVEAAGGGIVAWDGGSAALGGSVVAYGDPALRDAALEILNA